MSRGIRVCVPVLPTMHPMKRSHINWSIDRDWMIWSSIGMSASMIELLSVVSSDISESTFNHNGCLIQSMHDSYYQLTNISQVIFVVERLAPIDNTLFLLVQVASYPRTSLHSSTRKRVITCHRKDSVNDKQKKMSKKEQQRKRVRYARWNVTWRHCSTASFQLHPSIYRRTTPTWMVLSNENVQKLKNPLLNHWPRKNE